MGAKTSYLTTSIGRFIYAVFAGAQDHPTGPVRAHGTVPAESAPLAGDTIGVFATPDGTSAADASTGSPVAVRSAAGASGITFTCDPSIHAVAGVCDTLNTRIAGLYASTFSNATANMYVTFGDTGLGSSDFWMTRVSYSAYRAAHGLV